MISLERWRATRSPLADDDATRGVARSTRVARLVLPSLLFIALGALVAVLFDGTGANAIAIFLVGVGCVVAVSTVFWWIGRSEDRERGP
jgi:fucose 4-O-acetylase-like acetyltransferase